MRTQSTIRRAVLVIAFGCAPVIGTEYTFIATEGTWDDGDDWTPSGGPPVVGDTATIPDGKICSVTNYTAACDNFTVEDGGELLIEDDGTLATCAGPSCNENVPNVVEGFVRLRGTLTIVNDLKVGTSADSGTLRMASEDGTYTSKIDGDGKVIISGDPNKGFLEGTGIIEVDVENNGWGGAWGPEGFGCAPNDCCGPCEGPLTLTGELTGTGEWRAWDGFGSTVGGELIVDTAVNSFSGIWQTYAGVGNNRIVFKKTVCVTGNVNVFGNGGLEIEDDFCTTGELQMQSVGARTASIKVLQGKVATFHVSSCCDG